MSAESNDQHTTSRNITINGPHTLASSLFSYLFFSIWLYPPLRYFFFLTLGFCHRVTSIFNRAMIVRFRQVINFPRFGSDNAISFMGNFLCDPRWRCTLQNDCRLSRATQKSIDCNRFRCGWWHISFAKLRFQLLIERQNHSLQQNITQKGVYRQRTKPFRDFCHFIATAGPFKQILKAKHRQTISRTKYVSLGRFNNHFSAYNFNSNQQSPMSVLAFSNDLFLFGINVNFYAHFMNENTSPHTLNKNKIIMLTLRSCQTETLARRRMCLREIACCEFSIWANVNR